MVLFHGTAHSFVTEVPIPRTSLQPNLRLHNAADDSSSEQATEAWESLKDFHQGSWKGQARSFTVTPDVAKAVKDAKGGAIEFRAEKAGIIHAGVGKASFDEKKLGWGGSIINSSMCQKKESFLRLLH